MSNGIFSEARNKPDVQSAECQAVLTAILAAADVARCKRDMVRLKPNPKGRSTRIERVGLVDGMDHQGYRVASAQGKGFTLCANSGGPGGKSGLYLVKRTIRKLNARECARMQGFPESFTPHTNQRTATKQFGTSIAIQVASAIAQGISIQEVVLLRARRAAK